MRVFTIERAKIPAVSAMPGITPAIRRALEAAYREASAKGWTYAVSHLDKRDKAILDHVLATRPR